MKKAFIIIFTLFMIVCNQGFAQYNGMAFSVTIDSVVINSPNRPAMLLSYLTIKNNSSETLEFRECVSSKSLQEERGWNLIIKQDGLIPCEWEMKYMSDIYAGPFTIKKGQILKKVVFSSLNEMVVSDLSGGIGTYTIQLELSNLKSKKVQRQTVRSNIVNFKINNKIATSIFSKE